MPLKSTPRRASKKTRRKIMSENIKTEMEAGKPQKQAVAIGEIRNQNLNEENKMTEETKETKTETIDTSKVEEILIYLIKALLNKEIEAERGQVILHGLSLLHLIRQEKEKNAQQKTN
jgi:hypothetical protein